MRFFIAILLTLSVLVTEAQQRRTLQIDADTTTRPTSPLYGLAVVNDSLYLVPATGNMIKVGGVDQVTIADVIGLQTELNLKENIIATGSTSQYFRGDKTWQTLNKSTIGLSNVDNTSDVNKPISTATSTALSGKQANLVSGANIKTVESLSILGSGNLDITKTMVGLSNVDNTSDLNKPISTATAAALSGKEPIFSKGTAFNKNFGTAAGTVAQGNHGHDLTSLTGTDNLIEADTLESRAVFKLPNYVADQLPEDHHLVLESDYILTWQSGIDLFDTLQFGYQYHNLLRDSIELKLTNFDTLYKSDAHFHVTFFGSDSADSLFVYAVDSVSWKKVVDNSGNKIDSVQVNNISSIIYFSDTVFFKSESSGQICASNYMSSDHPRNPYRIPRENSPIFSFNLVWVPSEQKYYIR